jgi:hypothetical protein
MTLDDAICLITGDPLLDQGEQHSLAEHQAAGRLEVCQHPIRVDHEPVDKTTELDQHVVKGDRGVGKDHPLCRGMRDVALVPEGDVLQTDLRVAAKQSRHAGHPLRENRVSLVRHRRGALLAFSELLHDLRDLRPL